MTINTTTPHAAGNIVTQYDSIVVDNPRSVFGIIEDAFFTNDTDISFTGLDKGKDGKNLFAALIMK
jgi:hypothetical protein